jgi:hypothetical protein
MSNDFRKELDSLSWNDLRVVARQKYGIANPRLNREQLTEEVIAASKDTNRSQVVVDLESAVPPGWARISIQRGNTPTEKEPVQVCVNVDSNFTILRGHVVEVPIKIYRALINAKNDYVYDDIVELQPGQSETIHETTDFVVQLHGITPGPDPRPNQFEVAMRRRSKQIRALAAEHGQPWMGESTFLAKSGAKPRAVQNDAVPLGM